MRRTNTFAVRPLSEQDEQLLRDLMERLYDDGVATVYVEDLTDVLSNTGRQR